MRSLWFSLGFQDFEKIDDHSYDAASDESGKRSDGSLLEDGFVEVWIAIKVNHGGDKLIEDVTTYAAADCPCKCISHDPSAVFFGCCAGSGAPDSSADDQKQKINKC
jgi:hypothetical protein